MKSFSGNEIFRDALDRDAIAAIPYKVIDERVEPQTAFQDIYKVTEVYGYAPPETFNSYSGEVVQFPALRDTSADNKVEESVSFRHKLGQIVFTDKESLFNEGDWLSFTMARKVISTDPYQYAYGARATQLSQVVEVRIESSARVCYCTDVSWFIYETNTTADSQTLIDGYGSRGGTATRGFTVRDQFNAQASITNFITYHTAFPGVDDRLKIFAGDNEVQEINSATTPTFAQWQTWKTDGTLVCLLEPEIAQVGALYKKTVKKCRAR